MGYTTDLYGSVTITPPLNADEQSYLRDFAETRRMRRDNGAYFVKGDGYCGQGDGPDRILDYNTPPPGQPGLRCQWVPTDDGAGLEHDGGDKFYNAVEWMQYLIDHFLRPGARAKGSKADERLARFTFDHVVNGTINAEGEESGDLWRLVVTDNRVDSQSGTVTYQ